MQGKGGGRRGTTAHYMHLNRHILDCGSTGELRELIQAHAEEFNHAYIHHDIYTQHCA